jgi:hypothetical protein
MKRKIIAINGKIGSGKDTLCDILCELLLEREEKIYRGKFALPINNLITELTGHTDFSQEGKNTRLPQYSMTVGELQQKIGQGLRDVAHQDLWTCGLTHTISKLPKSTIIITTDLRYYNEVAILKNVGAVTVRLDGDPAGVRAKSKRNLNHQSEIDLDQYQGWDYRYDNSSDLTALRCFANEMITSLEQNNFFN